MLSPALWTLPQTFFERDPVLVARELLGCTLVRTLDSGEQLSGLIVETEAYDCPRDPACFAGRFHAARTQAMTIAPGRWLFWMAYGHPLLQISCRPEGIAASVLIRALEPLDGVERMLDLRPITALAQLTNGPAKLVQALGLTPEAISGQSVTAPTLHLVPSTRPSCLQDVLITPRIGVRAGRELPWRFCVRGNPWVSGP